MSPTAGLDIQSAYVKVPEQGPVSIKVKATMVDGKVIAEMHNGYFFNNRTNSLAGPFNSNITAITARDNSAEMYAVNENKEILKTDLLDLNDGNLSDVTFTPDLETSFSGAQTPGVIGNDKGSFLYRGQYIGKPFDEPKEGSGKVYDPMFFKDCTLSIAETHWMHFGSEAAEKEVYRIDLNFHKNSYGHLWLYVQNDTGKVSGQYKGQIKDKETVKVFTNIRGRRFRTKMFIATHKDYPWAMREMAVGYNIGKSF